MPSFRYKAVSQSGENVSGVIQAYDEFEAISQIRESCSMVTSISEVSGESKNILTMELGSPMVKHKTLALLCSQFAIALNAGLPLVRATQLIQEQTTDRPLKRLLGEVSADVSAGYGLAQSLEQKGAKMLPTTFIETIQAAESTGTLEVAFQKLAAYYDSSAKVKAKVRSAMMYPLFLLALACIVIGIIMVVVMPVFVEMFQSLNAELPALTLWLMGVSDFFGKWWWLVALVLLALFAAFKWYISTEQGSLWFDKTLLKVPVIGRVSEMKGASQFANTMSTLLTAGLPMIQAVGSTGKTLDNSYLGRQLELILPRLEEGRRLGDCMQDGSDFPPLLKEMTSMGEETGSLEETLNTIGHYYDVEVETSSQRALGMLQPAITVILGLVIGIVVIALYLPMFTMYGAM